MFSCETESKGQIYFGSDAFVEKMQTKIDQHPRLTEIPRAPRRTLSRALSDFEKTHDRNEAIALAYLSGHHTMAVIAEHFGVHSTTVSRLVKRYQIKGVSDNYFESHTD